MSKTVTQNDINTLAEALSIAKELIGGSGKGEIPSPKLSRKKQRELKWKRLLDKQSRVKKFEVV